MKHKLYLLFKSYSLIILSLFLLLLLYTNISILQDELLSPNFDPTNVWQINPHLSHYDKAIANQGLNARKLLEDGVIIKGNVEIMTSSNSSSSRINLSNVTLLDLGLDHRLPQCIIIGARKCGTRALLNFLSLHSKIVTPGDEMHFFSNDSTYQLGLDWYRKCMPLSSSDQITIEKTPKYFVSPIAPARVHNMNSSIKLIVILRHPTTRLISDFTQVHRRNKSTSTPIPFESMAIDHRKNRVNLEYKALRISIYHQHISRWLQWFPRSQLLVLDGEALIKNPLSQISRAETFLGLKHEVKRHDLYFNKSRGFFCMRRQGAQVFNKFKCMGVNKGRKHVNISDAVMTKLNRFYRPHNEQLFKIIGHRFSWR